MNPVRKLIQKIAMTISPLLSARDVERIVNTIFGRDHRRDGRRDRVESARALVAFSVKKNVDARVDGTPLLGEENGFHCRREKHRAFLQDR